MLRLLTQNFSGIATGPQKSLLRQVPAQTVSSCAAMFSPQRPSPVQHHVLLKPRMTHPASFKMTNYCVFHTSSSNLDLQKEFQKRLKYMLSHVDWREARSSPPPALWLGAAGVIPFVMPPLFILLEGSFLPNLAFAQLAYGASILSFLGGVKWGIAVPEVSGNELSWKNLSLSVSLALIGWSSLLLPPWVGNLVLIGGLGASAYIDITSPKYPRWFKALRLSLSSVAMGSLTLMVFLRLAF